MSYTVDTHLGLHVVVAGTSYNVIGKVYIKNKRYIFYIVFSPFEFAFKDWSLILAYHNMLRNM